MTSALIEGDFTISYVNDPPAPATQAPYAPGTMFGGMISNSLSNAANAIVISPLKFRDIDDTQNIVIATAITKRLDALWAPGDGNGCLDAGAKQPNATYHIFGIGNPTTGECDILASASATNPVMPAGFTAKCRASAILTDANGAIKGFIQVGGWFYSTGVTPAPQLSNVNIVAPVRLKLPVPTGIKVLADFTALLSGASGNSFLCIRDPDAGNAGIYDNIANGPAFFTGGQCFCWTNTLGEISVFGSAAGALVNIYPRGWYDGRDAFL